MSKIYRMIAPTGEAFETENPEWHKSCRVVKKAEYLAARKDYARLMLSKMIEPGSVIYTKVLHVSRSGMMRRISAYVTTKDNPPQITCIDHLFAELTHYKHHDAGGIIMDGCGMDMTFALVYALGAAMWPDGTPAPHGTRNGEPDSDGGYALKNRNF